ncbi:MAG: DUF6478 family protein [Paracoccus sp. (in: a-proteobacteria)]|nr:DUF6478 family protein [Paracoccus sp. (in: a-proteobacteria)]
MAFRPRNWMRRMMRRRVQEDWSRLGGNVPHMGAGQLRELRAEAGMMRQVMDRFLMRSDPRVIVSKADLAALPLPGGTDWRWRPEFLSSPVSPAGIAAPASGARLGEAAALWHDCPEQSLILRQIRNAGATDLAAFGLRVEVMSFAGGFLSLSVDLPPEVLSGLTRNYILRLETAIEIERDLDIYARLNIANGPNTEEMLRHLGGMRAGAVSTNLTEFDLALTEMNERRLDKIWLDLIFERPQMNAAVIREMVLSRHPRANI